LQGQQYYSDKLTLSFDVFCRKKTKSESLVPSRYPAFAGMMRPGHDQSTPIPFIGIHSTDFVSASFVLECFFPDQCPRPSKEDQKDEIGNAKWLPHARDSGGKPVEQNHPTVRQL